MRKLSVAVVALSSLALTGCATLFGGGSSQTVNLIPSDGKPHTVSVQSKGRSDFDIDIPKAIPVNRNSKPITIIVKDSKDGEIPPTTIKPKLNPAFAGNILPLGLACFLSSSVDWASGAAWKYDENATVNVTKEAAEAAAAAEKAEKAKKAAEREASEAM